jgi:hypothetical protein
MLVARVIAATQRKRISAFKAIVLGLLLIHHEPFQKAERHMKYGARHEGSGDGLRRAESRI